MKISSEREPLFHITKRGDMLKRHKILIYAVAIAGSMILSSVICAIASGENPFSVLLSMLSGPFLTERKLWVFLKDLSLLLIVSFGVLVSFKMHFWNLGANGQILAGCLATSACMFLLGGKMPDGVLNIIMIISAILAGAIWAVIPAIFKAFFNTNESLFTLMMNYIAEVLVAYFITLWVNDGSNILRPMANGRLPVLFDNKYMLPILVAAIISAAITIYLKYSKHGYEISVVGESLNTAKYIGINVKKVVIRTLVLSGAVCGIAGLILSGGINYSMSAQMHNGLGFTAIMTSWLAKFNPLMMIATCFLITFLSNGMGQVRMDFGFTNDSISNIVLGIIYFCIIACDFFINYKINFAKSKNEGEKAE